MFKNALVSVSDKRGLADFLRPLVAKGMRLVSSGGTATYLREHGFSVVTVSEQTGFPEVMDGRVKTLHPRIHMALLCRPHLPEDQSLLREQGLEPFDLVIANLYPFAQALEQQKPEAEMIEFIDIGGPSLLRAAAKSFSHITVVCDPEDYIWVGSKKALSLSERKSLAGKVFDHVAKYDRKIADYLLGDQASGKLQITAEHHQVLRYGENPQQKADWYRLGSMGLQQAQILQGKELSFNNILDLSAALSCVKLFSEPAVVAVKHNNPCGVAVADSIVAALKSCLVADPVSVFGGILAFNRELDLACVEACESLFLECLIAPSVSAQAQERLSKKKNLRVLQWPQMQDISTEHGSEVRSVLGGLLVQSSDRVEVWSEEWQVVSGELTEKARRGLGFAWRVCSALKSNAIAITSQDQTLGLGMGQVNRVDAVKQAFERQKRFHPEAGERYLASDAFFPFEDSIKLAHEFGVTAIVQPGGSLRDAEVIEAAKKLKIPMVLTKRRHFRH